MSNAGSHFARRAFLDTSAFYALADAADTNHSTARSIATLLARERYRLFSTNFVLAETHALLLSRLGVVIARRTLEKIDNSHMTIIRVSAGDELRAREIISQYVDKDFSLTDAASFAVMERLRITLAFTFDHHFAQYKFTLLRAEDP